MVIKALKKAGLSYAVQEFWDKARAMEDEEKPVLPGIPSVKDSREKEMEGFAADTWLII